MHAAFGRHRERRSRVAIQPYLAAVAGLTAGLLRFTRNDALKQRFRLNTACSSAKNGPVLRLLYQRVCSLGATRLGLNGRAGTAPSDARPHLPAGCRRRAAVFRR